MGFDIKITTFSGILDLIAPYSCRGCGQLGEVLCECCKNYNIKHMAKICSRCRKSIEKCKCDVPVYTASCRDGLMKNLVEDYKYQSIRGLDKVLAEMLGKALPEDLRDTIIVPLPTTSKHIRERGFDHTLRLARALSKMDKSYSFEQLIIRNNNTVQVGSDAKTRKRQAKEAYLIKAGKVDCDKKYLLIDDVWTTGASMEAAIDLMKKAGAKHLTAAVILTARK